MKGPQGGRWYLLGRSSHTLQWVRFGRTSQIRIDDPLLWDKLWQEVRNPRDVRGLLVIVLKVWYPKTGVRI